MTDAIYQLIYCSRVAAVSPVELASILAVSRANNARDGLSGALLYNRGLFAQVLEGPLAAVERTFERIQCDARHDDVVVLQFGEVGQRAFSDWLMADAGAALDPATAALPADLLSKPAGNAADEVVAILRGLVSREADWAIAS